MITNDTPTIEPGVFYEGRGTHYVCVYPGTDRATQVSGFAMTPDARLEIKDVPLAEAQAWLEQACSDDMGWVSKVLPPARHGSRRVGLVYFISDEDGYIKIGYAVDPEQRRRDLQVAHRQQLTLIATLAGGASREAELHRQFKASHVRGEWFSPTPELTDFIAAQRATREQVAA